MWNKTGSKFGNKKTPYNGRIYDSKREAMYAYELDLLKSAKNDSDRVISYLNQVPYLLQDSFKDKKGTTHRKIEYVADFVVHYADGREEVIDVKGMRTEMYKLKLKLLLFKYPDINFKEVE